MLCLNVILSIVYFKGLVLSIAPFLADSTIVDLGLNVFTVAIDVVISYTFLTWFFKTPPGEAVT